MELKQRENTLTQHHNHNIKNIKKTKVSQEGLYQGKHRETKEREGDNSRKHGECRKKKTIAAKGIFHRHASAVTFSHHATGPVISTCWVFMTPRARKPLGAEAIPKDAKQEKAPQCKHKSKLTRPELIRFAFIISSL